MDREARTVTRVNELKIVKCLYGRQRSTSTFRKRYAPRGGETFLKKNNKRGNDNGLLPPLQSYSTAAAAPTRIHAAIVSRAAEAE